MEVCIGDMVQILLNIIQPQNAKEIQILTGQGNSFEQINASYFSKQLRPRKEKVRAWNNHKPWSSWNNVMQPHQFWQHQTCRNNALVFGSIISISQRSFILGKGTEITSSILHKQNSIRCRNSIYSYKKTSASSHLSHNKTQTLFWKP